jgi:hypothetical protein
MLIYGIVRHIITMSSFYPYNVSCTFPAGDRYIDIILTAGDNVFAKASRLQLDSGAPKEVMLASRVFKKVSLDTTPENRT